MITNQWNKDAIIRAYERDLNLEQIQEHFAANNFSLVDIKNVIREKYPYLTL